MKSLIFVLLFMGLPTVPANTFYDEVDMIECNTFHDENCMPVFTQMIYWDWDSFRKDWVVRAWKINNDVWVKNEEHKKEWDKQLREYCDKNPHVPFSSLQNRYKGEYAPTPGINYPRRTKNGWEMVFYSDGARIVVRSGIFRDTNTQYDPEMRDRRKFPETQRKGLKGFGKTNLDNYEDN